MARKPSRAKRHLSLFTVVLALVLVTGLAAMALYSGYLNLGVGSSGEGNDRVNIDFVSIPK